MMDTAHLMYLAFAGAFATIGGVVGLIAATSERGRRLNSAARLAEQQNLEAQDKPVPDELLATGMRVEEKDLAVLGIHKEWSRPITVRSGVGIITSAEFLSAHAKGLHLYANIGDKIDSPKWFVGGRPHSRKPPRKHVRDET